MVQGVKRRADKFLACEKATKKINCENISIIMKLRISRVAAFIHRDNKGISHETSDFFPIQVITHMQVN